MAEDPTAESRSSLDVAPGRRARLRPLHVGQGVVALTLFVVLAVLTLSYGSAVTPPASPAGAEESAHASGKGGTGSTAAVDPSVTLPPAGTTNAPAHAPGRPFTYGFDLAKQGPYNLNNPSAQSARQVMSAFPGVYEDVPIMGWGPGNPEPSPGMYDFSQIAERIKLVQAAGGIPVITFAAAPDWMKGGVAGTTNWSLIDVPPTAQHYQDFALLCARVAQMFTQVKSFVVWKELKGFWNATTSSWDAAGYTAMYNDVYQAVKAVRPDANVGGPYVSMKSYSTGHNALASTPTGPWGTLDQTALNAVSYWMANKVGADFVAVDGTAFTKDAGLITDPLTSVGKYAAADAWLASQTTLPIVWMESHLLPDPALYTDQQQAAVRVAALIEMATSGASVGLQWQPEDQIGWDEGLWTSTLNSGGGQSTVLGQELPAVLSILAAPTTLVPEPPGVVAATGANGTVTVTMTGSVAGVVVQANTVSKPSTSG